MLSKEKKTDLLLGLFVGAIVAANLIGLKIADFGLFHASVGVIVLPVTFLVTDIVEEVYGKDKAKEFVFIGIAIVIFTFAVTGIALWLPFAGRSLVKGCYTKVFGTTLRIFLGSIVGFALSQTHDLWAFNFWKEKTGGRFLWLRNNFSTIASQFVDTTVFMFIAFYGISPQFTAAYVFSLIVPYWLAKVLFALGDTPFCYLGVRWLEKEGGSV